MRERDRTIASCRSTLSVLGPWLLIPLTSLPAALHIHMLVLAVRASAYLGYWPQYDKPDPNDLPPNLAPFASLLDLVIPVLFMVTFSVLCIAALRRSLPPHRRFVAAAVVMLAGWLGAIALLRVDPGGVVAWCID